MRRVALIFLVAVICLAQGNWLTMTSLPNVDFSGLTKTQTDVALSVLRTETCTCGCNLKLAECRVVDTPCGYSRTLASFVVRDASLGKSADTVRADLRQVETQPPPVLAQPIRLSVDGDPMKGPPNAKVTIVEFSDFQCPFCAKATGEVAQILQRYPKDVRFFFKQFPLETHSQAALAAEASLAAQAQGKFWEMHDKMYSDFRHITHAKILLWAKEVGLDMGRFTSELDSHKYAARVASEENQGERAGVEGTPTFFIDGKKLNASFEMSTVAPLISEELKH